MGLFLELGAGSGIHDCDRIGSKCMNEPAVTQQEQVTVVFGTKLVYLRITCFAIKI